MPPLPSSSPKLAARLAFAALALTASSALAADVSRGHQAFTEACARCHAATPPRDGERRWRTEPAAPRPGSGPDLVDVLQDRNHALVRAFVRDPQQARPGTSCDTRLLDASRYEDLMAFLVSRTSPLPPPRLVRLQRQAAAEAKKYPGHLGKRPGRLPPVRMTSEGISK